MVNILFNGESLLVENNITLQTFLENQDLADKKGFAVAVNQQVVPKSEWSVTKVRENDNLIVVTATQGG